jgi:HAD superfamily hydrolase (TIGR01509 family)
VRSIKPQPAIYEHCLEGLGVKADRAIFFDDRIANCQGAEMLGLRAIEFLDRDTVLALARA